LTIVQPDPVWIDTELRRVGVTLELLHLEYLREHPDGYRYTAFCDIYRRWRGRRGLVMRQQHKAGEEAFADYSGKRPSIVKAKVEVAVQIAQRWILARLRNETFFSLETLNERIAELLEELNERPMKGLGGITQRALFERIERAALLPLPKKRFVVSEWKVSVREWMN